MAGYYSKEQHDKIKKRRKDKKKGLLTGWRRFFATAEDVRKDRDAKGQTKDNRVADQKRERTRKAGPRRKSSTGGPARHKPSAKSSTGGRARHTSAPKKPTKTTPPAKPKSSTGGSKASKPATKVAKAKRLDTTDDKRSARTKSTEKSRKGTVKSWIRRNFKQSQRGRKTKGFRKWQDRDK